MKLAQISDGHALIVTGEDQVVGEVGRRTKTEDRVIGRDTYRAPGGYLPSEVRSATEVSGWSWREAGHRTWQGWFTTRTEAQQAFRDAHDVLDPDAATDLVLAAIDKRDRQRDDLDLDVQKAVRAAFVAGASPTKLAAVSGLSRRRIYQLRDGDR